MDLFMCRETQNEALSVNNIAINEVRRNDGGQRCRVWFCELHYLVIWQVYMVSEKPTVSIIGVEYVLIQNIAAT